MNLMRVRSFANHTKLVRICWLKITLAVNVAFFGCNNPASYESSSAARESCNSQISLALDLFDPNYGNEWACLDNLKYITPKIFASIPELSLARPLSIQEIFAAEQREILCAPGKIEFENSPDELGKNKAWNFNHIPEFFSFHYNRLSEQERFSFFLAEKNGAPLPANSLEIVRSGQGLIIIAINQNIDPSQTYYLYAKKHSRLKNSVWVQPITFSL